MPFLDPIVMNPAWARDASEGFKQIALRPGNLPCTFQPTLSGFLQSFSLPLFTIFLSTSKFVPLRRSPNHSSISPSYHVSSLLDIPPKIIVTLPRWITKSKFAWPASYGMSFKPAGHSAAKALPLVAVAAAVAVASPEPVAARPRLVAVRLRLVVTRPGLVVVGLPLAVPSPRLVEGSLPLTVPSPRLVEDSLPLVVPSPGLAVVEARASPALPQIAVPRNPPRS